MSWSAALNRALAEQRGGWVASIHNAEGLVIGIGGSVFEMAFGEWYRDQAERAVIAAGAVVIVWRGGAAVSAIAARQRQQGEGVAA